MVVSPLHCRLRTSSGVDLPRFTPLGSADSASLRASDRAQSRAIRIFLVYSARLRLAARFACGLGALQSAELVIEL
jgi:hypothetical protein